MKYRNKGAPFTRDDGSEWASGEVCVPTENELRRRRYKLRAVVNVPTPQAAAISQAGSEGWPLQMQPNVYLRLHPTGKHAELARQLLGVDAGDTEQPAEEGASSNGAADE